MWQTIWTLMLRHLINDVDSPQQYTDNRLQTALLVGAQFVNNEFTLQTSYVIDFIGLTITPDPTATTANGALADEWMTNLTVAKTAVIMLRNNLKLASLSAWTIKDTDVNIDLRQMAVVTKQLLDDIEEWYSLARMTYSVGVNPSVQAVLTPINIWAGGSRIPTCGTTRDRLVW